VKIDDRTFGELNKPWPLSRSLHARVIDRLHAAGAREIVYDVQFTEPRPGNQDIDLYDAIGAAGGVTLATSQSDAQGHTNVLGGDANLARVHARAAAANLTTSEGGVITHYPYEVSHLKSLAVTAAEVAGGKPISSSCFPGGPARIRTNASAPAGEPPRTAPGRASCARSRRSASASAGGPSTTSDRAGEALTRNSRSRPSTAPGCRAIR